MPHYKITLKHLILYIDSLDVKNSLKITYSASARQSNQSKTLLVTWNGPKSCKWYLPCMNAS